MLAHSITYVSYGIVPGHWSRDLWTLMSCVLHVRTALAEETISGVLPRMVPLFRSPCQRHLPASPVITARLYPNGLPSFDPLDEGPSTPLPCRSATRLPMTSHIMGIKQGCALQGLPARHPLVSRACAQRLTDYDRWYELGRGWPALDAMKLRCMVSHKWRRL